MAFGWYVFVHSFIIIFCTAEQFQQTKLILPLDVLAYASLHLPVCNLPTVFIEGIIRQLRAMAHCLVKYSVVLISFLYCFRLNALLLQWPKFSLCLF